MVGTPPPNGQAVPSAAQATQGGQQQVAQQQQQLQPVNGGARTRRVCGSKPPKYSEVGGFDLYRAQIEGFLQQNDCWDVIGGNTASDPTDAEWVEKNNFARCALLFGLLPKDSKKVCKMATAREMWTSFEQDKTKRAYASETRLRRDMYVTKFTPGEDMEKYLDRLDEMRRRLENMNAVVTDEEMVKLILQGVVDSHRNVVRMFDRNNGATPDLATVRNVLLGEAETDKACAGEEATEVTTKATKLMALHPATTGNPKKKFMKGNKKVSSKETRKCFFCKKKGHLRADCYGWKALQNKKSNESEEKGSGNDSKKGVPMKMVWSGELGDTNNPPVPIRMVQKQDVAATLVSAHDWTLDSGAGAHVCVNGGSFVKLVKDPLVKLDWQGGMDTNEYSGLIKLEVQPSKYLELPAARYAPGGTVNLISQRLLERDGWKPSYSDTDDDCLRCTYFDKDEIRLMFKKKEDGFYWMKASPMLNVLVLATRTVETLEDNLVMKWHLKLAHLNEAAIKKMVQDGLADGMDGITLADFKKTPLKCMACEEAKAKRMAFKRQIGKRATQCGARLMSDVCYVGIQTPGRAKYFQLIQDEASRYKWVYLLNKKSEAADNVMTLILELEKDFPVKMFLCDQGGEFLNHRLATFFREHVIRLLTTNAYSPEENCLVEKLNGKLLSKVRAIREAANLPACLWGEILNYGVHIDNMSATKALKDMTPYEKLKDCKPDMKNLKVCGCGAYYHIPKERQENKLEMRARPALFLGLAESTLGYRLLDLKTGDMVQRRSVHFREDVAVGSDYVERLIAKQYYGKRTTLPDDIPFVLMPVTRVAITDSVAENSGVPPEVETADDQEEKRPTPASSSTKSDDGDSSSSDESDWEYLSIDEADNRHDDDDDGHGGACGATGQRSGTSTDGGALGAGTSGSSTTSTGSSGVSGSSGSVATSSRATGSGTSGRSTTRTATNNGSGGNRNDGGSTGRTSSSISAAGRSTTTTPRRSGRQRRPNSKYNPSAWVMTLTLTQCMLIGAVNNILNPLSRQLALASEHAEGWRRAMDEEYAALMRNGTWELVPRPQHRKGRRRANILTSVWVLVVKRNAKGDVERLKARLAIRGFLQKFGLDYLETYSPVVRIESVRLILLIAMFLGLECKHVDFVTAFLNGELVDVGIYMEQPERYEDGTDRVCRLKKGLYGLKQASKIWNDTLHKVLVELGFVQCTCDAGVYWRRRDERVVFLTVYVDDIILAGVPADIAGVVDELVKHFKLKDLGRVHHLLGMEVNYCPRKMLCLSQTAYSERLAEKFGLSSAKPVRSPQFHHEKTLKIERDLAKINDPKLPYREIVGSLQYLVMCTRPDLANAVRTLGRYTSAYTIENYRAAQRVVRYALATKNLGMVYRAAPEGVPMMDAFCDADHQSCPETSRSVTGYTLRLHGNTWMWKSHGQRRVTEDTCSSELVACCECTKMVIWARELLLDLGYDGKELQVPVYCDNQSTIAVVANIGNTSRVRHMAKHARFINEYIQAKQLDVTYVPSADNLADVFSSPRRWDRQNLSASEAG